MDSTNVLANGSQARQVVLRRRPDIHEDGHTVDIHGGQPRRHRQGSRRTCHGTAVTMDVRDLAQGGRRIDGRRERGAPIEQGRGGIPHTDATNDAQVLEQLHRCLPDGDAAGVRPAAMNDRIIGRRDGDTPDIPVGLIAVGLRRDHIRPNQPARTGTLDVRSRAPASC